LEGARARQPAARVPQEENTGQPPEAKQEAKSVQKKKSWFGFVTCSVREGAGIEKTAEHLILDGSREIL